MRAKPNLIGLIAALVISTTALLPLPALAKPSGPTVLWTFPYAGQRDVPTNAQLWVVGYAISRPTATLDGAPIALERLSFASAATRSVMLDLEPNTEYEVAFDFDSAETLGVREHITIAFATGNSHLAPLPAPVVHGSMATPGMPSDHACEDVIHTQDYFDTGQNTLVSIDVEVEGDAVGWLLLPQTGGGGGFGLAWPTSCGAPTLFTGTFGWDCYDLYAIGAAGHVGAGTRYCAQPEDDPGRPFCYEIIAVQPSGEYGPPRSSCDSTTPDSTTPDAGVPSDERDASVVVPAIDASSGGAPPDGSVVAPDQPNGGSGEHDETAVEPLDAASRDEPSAMPSAPEPELERGSCTVASLFSSADSSAPAWPASFSALVMLLCRRAHPRRRPLR